MTLLSVSVTMSRERRSLSQLRQVVSVLEQQGRLHEVDSDLLARINDALDNDNGEGSEGVSDEVGSSERKHVSAVSAKEAFLERARQRQLRLLESRERLRGSSRVSPPRSSSSRVASQCEEYEAEVARLQRENERLEAAVRSLKRDLMSVEEELELSQERLTVSARHISHNNSPLDKLSQLGVTSNQVQVPASPLDKLLQAAESKEDEQVAPGVIISSSLITPTPIVSTIFSTVR